MDTPAKLSEVDRRQALAALAGVDPGLAFTVADRAPLASPWPGVTVERLTLAGRDGPVRAFLTAPVGAARNRPAVLAIHAHGNRHAIGASELLQGRPAILDPPWGRALAEAGFLTLCPDLPGFGERSAEQESALAKRRLWQGGTLFGDMLSELLAARRLLAGLPDVDPARIGAAGLSMGATLAFWLGALEPKVRAVAHQCCLADLAMLVESGAHDLHGPYMTVPGLLPRFRTGEIAGMLAPRPQLVCIGADDPLTPPAALATALADLRAAYAAADAGDSLEVLVEPGVGHRETPGMRHALLDFLGRRL
jgi:pimeloyl-ACP methyl ester carboxylesterase